MKILFVSAVFPYPLHSGGQVRIYNLLKKLSLKHEITLFAFIRNASEKQYIAELSFCKKVVVLPRGRAWQPKYILKTIFSSFPFLYVTYDHVFVKKMINVEMKNSKYDLVHIEPGYIYPSIPEAGLPLVVAEHNIEHSVYKGYAEAQPFPFLQDLLMKDVAKMKKWENKIWKIASHIIAVSDDDRAYIQQRVPTANISVVANGVDIDFFNFRDKRTIDSKKLTFLYVGNFSWMQNTDAVSFILQKYWNEIGIHYPGSMLRIVGKHFPKYLKRQLPDNVIAIESVADIRSEYASADILLAPIRIGGGTRYKILESMAAGLPVITSTLGASGLQVSSGKELYIADTSEEVLSSIHSLCIDKKRKELVSRARQLIELHYSWDRIANVQDDVWSQYEK